MVERYYYLVMILLLTVGSAWQYRRLKRLSERVTVADYTLKQTRYKLTWTKFISPAILLFSSLYESINFALLLCAVFFFFSTIIEWLLNSKYGYDAYVIRGNILVRNELKKIDFNLEELTIIDFLPFTDAFKLKFKGGQSVSISSAGFKKEALYKFLNIAIGKSKLPVSIADDAKSKINRVEKTSA